jgi:hypothetical protein
MPDSMERILGEQRHPKSSRHCAQSAKLKYAGSSIESRSSRDTLAHQAVRFGEAIASPERPEIKFKRRNRPRRDWHHRLHSCTRLVGYMLAPGCLRVERDPERPAP